MASVIGGEPALIGSLRELIELNRDAVEALAAALARLSRPGDRSRFSVFLEDHERHLTELTELARELGVRPEGPGELRPRPTRGKLLNHGIMGDRVILEAMQTNEEDACTAYERAAYSDALPPRARALLKQSLSVERRHRDWITEQLEAREGLLLLPL
jgi:rubrerythrin